MANKDIAKIIMITNYWLTLYYSFHYDMLPSFCNLFTFFATYCSPSLLKELCDTKFIKIIQTVGTPKSGARGVGYGRICSL